MARIIKITESQFNEFVKNERERLYEPGMRTKKKSKQDFETDYVKANRKARRADEKERYGDGFKSTTRINKSDKTYSRKGKNKFKGDYNNDDE
jgi:hypothetical protein